jgi:citrate lyase beta subunit
VSPNALLWLRSLLFVPGAEERRFSRALESDADGVIFDLEDAVAPERKDEARALVVRAVGAPGARPARFVRINAPDTEWGHDDLEAIRDLPVDGIVVPKAQPEALALLDADGPPVIAIVETAAGVRSAYEVARYPRVEALMLGAADLGAELGLEPRADGLELLYARSALVVDSAAAGIRAPFDVVYLDTRDGDGLQREAELAKSLGFAGKPCVHPNQVDVVNRVFEASEEELTEAREVLDAYEAARARADGVTVVRGRMVDLPVVLRAQATLSRGGRK